MMKLLVLIGSMLFICSAQAKTLNFSENTDITDSLNKEIAALQDGGVLEIPAGSYKVDAVKSIQLKNNITIKMSPNTILNVIPNAQGGYKVFKIHGVSGINLSGGVLIGDRDNHLSDKGEWGMGVEIKDSQNVNIENMKINKMWGDAIYLGTNGKNSNYNINLTNIQMDKNRRQGISVISVNKLNANNITISNTRGKSPMNGVDIEPNDNRNVLSDINFDGLKSINNFAAGFQVSLHQYNNSKNKVSINLKNYSDEGSRFGLKINGVETPVEGMINIDNIDIKNNKTSNYCFQNWSNNKIVVDIKNMKNDKEYVKNKHEWCTPYKTNQYLKVSKKIH